jgi:hypothetical protein
MKWEKMEVHNEEDEQSHVDSDGDRKMRGKCTFMWNWLTQPQLQKQQGVEPEEIRRGTGIHRTIIAHCFCYCCLRRTHQMNHKGWSIRWWTRQHQPSHHQVLLLLLLITHLSDVPHISMHEVWEKFDRLEFHEKFCHRWIICLTARMLADDAVIRPDNPSTALVVDCLC